MNPTAAPPTPLVNTFDRRRGVLFTSLFALVIAVIALGPPPRPAAAASNGLWSVFPTTHVGQAPRPFVEPVLTPGKVYSDSVTVANYTSAALTFDIYAADAVNTAGGGLSLRARTAVQHDIGGWIHLPSSMLSVPAHGKVDVPFTIDAPRHAEPGDHVGGIVAEDTQGTTSKSGSVTVVQAVGVRIYGRVVGPLHPELALPKLSASVQRSITSDFNSSVDVRVKFRVDNTGNTVLSPVAAVRLTSPFGTAATKRFVVDEILPGSSLAYSLRFPGLTTYGHLRVEVSVMSQGASASEASAVWSVPWALLVLVVLAVGAVAWLLVRRRGRRHVQAQSAEMPPADRVDA